MKLPSEEDIAVPDPESQLVADVRATPDWAVPYMSYFARGELPADELLARQIIRRCKSMVIHKASCTNEALVEFFKDASRPKKAVLSLMRFTPTTVFITLGHDRWYRKPLYMDSIG